MRAMFRVEMKRALRSPLTYLAITAGLIMLLAGVWEDLTNYMREKDFMDSLALEGESAANTLNTWRVAMLLNPGIFILPILAVLPLGASLADDLSGKYTYFQLPRVGRKEYLSGKWLSAVTAGFWTHFCAAFLFALLIMVVQLPFDPLRDESLTKSVMNTYVNGVRYDSRLYTLIPSGAATAPVIFLTDSILWGCGGALCCCVSLLVTAWSQNRYVVLAAPFGTFFVFRLVMDQLSELSPLLSLLDPSALYTTATLRIYPPYVVLGAVLCELLLLRALYMRFGMRRLKSEL